MGPMPHIFFEYSDNLEDPDFPKVFAKFHQLLAEIADAKIESCKSRATKRETFYIGSGQKESAFIHVHALLASGRTVAVKQQLGTALLTYLKEEFAKPLEELDLQITIHVDEFDKSLYFKAPGQV